MDSYKAIQKAIELQRAGEFHKAEQILKEILEGHPDNIDALYFLGEISYQVKNYDSAIQYIKKALELNPTDADAFNNLGIILRENGQLEEAITCYQKALEINPEFSLAYYNLGSVFKEKGQFAKAITCYQKAIQFNPNLADAYNNLGIILRDNGQLEEAITCYQKAVEINPDLANLYYNMGAVLQDKNCFDEAIAYYQKSLELNPYLDDAYNNLGYSFKENNQIDEAMICFQKAVEINPNLAEAHWNMSHALLLSGNLKDGWREFEWRWKVEGLLFQRKFLQPLWDGSDITGNTILLYAEQGLGDTIQFIRYASLVARRCAAVIVESQKELKLLLQNVEGVNRIMEYGEPLPEFDVRCPLLNLPSLFDTSLDNIPNRIPYVTAEPVLVNKWRDKIKYDESKFKVGLVWAGNPKYKKDHYRSFSLITFSPLSQLKEITFYSVQKGEGAEQAKSPPGGMKLVDFTEELHNFTDTAALIENLDLVISADTAVAHLTGAMGKPIWTLLPFAPDWRWMLTREDSPWYPTMRLFRQHSTGNWRAVIDRVVMEIRDTFNLHDHR
jgi:tetratricopeptide (TPR) repeat protein